MSWETLMGQINNFKIFWFNFVETIVLLNSVGLLSFEKVRQFLRGIVMWIAKYTVILLRDYLKQNFPYSCYNKHKYFLSNIPELEYFEDTYNKELKIKWDLFCFKQHSNDAVKIVIQDLDGAVVFDSWLFNAEPQAFNKANKFLKTKWLIMESDKNHNAHLIG